MKRVLSVENLKTIVLFITVLVLLFLIYTMYLAGEASMKTPFETLPYETKIKAMGYSDSYVYATDEFNSCYEKSENVFDTYSCYSDRNKEIIEENKTINNDQLMYVNVYIKDNKVVRYMVSNGAYVSQGDKGRLYNDNLYFSYPENETVFEDYRPKPIITSEKIIQNYTEDEKEYQKADITVEITEDDETVIYFPMNLEKSQEYLEILSFSSDNSEEFVNKMKEDGILEKVEGSKKTN